MADPIYLDYNATTPVAPEVIDVVARVMRDAWGNPSSDHLQGRRAREAVESARGQVASLLGCRATEVVFTSGGTESNNAAIVGVAEARESEGRHLVTSGIEHPAVEQACRYLERRGWTVSRAGVDKDGRVDVQRLADALSDGTTLVTVMHANNETGVLQPVREIAGLAHARGATVHTDAAQSVGKVAVSLKELDVDLLTVAAHKLYGPQGVGALVLREGTPFAGFLHGAGHESGRRAGTENVAAIAGLGAACELARAELEQRGRHMRTLRDRLEAGLRKAFPGLVVHGGNVERLPNTLYAALPGVPAPALIRGVPEVAMGSGSACDSGASHVSATLSAMGVSEELARCTVRLCVGRATTAAEIDRAIECVVRGAQRLDSGN